MPGLKNQQLIDFNKSDESCPTFIHSSDVMVHPSSITREMDSKANRYILGNLVSYHPHTRIVAYVLSLSDNFMIRVINEENSTRCLIKEFGAEIKDIAFSRSKIPFVASIDVNGSVKIYKVIVDIDSLASKLILEIKPNLLEAQVTSNMSYNRIMWCCRNDVDEMVIEEADIAETNISLLLGIVHGSMFEVLQVDTIESELLSRGEPYNCRLGREDLKSIANSFQEQYRNSESLSDLFLPYLRYTSPSDSILITSLAISGDAAAFAVALQNGYVHFFTLDGSAPSGLKEAYSWRPFDGDVVWSLLFLDDCRPGNRTDSFWCHVVVGGAFNRQLKMFRCDKWDCIQTVTFHVPSSPCLLSAHIDLSSRFLIMSDIRRKALFLLQIESIDGGNTKLFKSVQQFILTQPLLSFDIDSIVCTPTVDGAQQVVMKLFTITKTAFQKIRVTYITKGHRLAEIMQATNVTNFSDDVDDDRHSILTQVSKLPSVASSFQDPAIIRSHECNSVVTTGVLDDVPEQLRHLFASLSIQNNKLFESGSKDRTDDDPPETMHLKRSAEGFEGVNRIPSPHFTNWNTDLKENVVTNESLISRLTTMMEIQKRDIESLSRNVRDLRQDLLRQSAEVRQGLGDRGIKEIGDNCEKVLSTRLGSCVRDAVDGVAQQIAGDVGNRLGVQVRDHMAAVEPSMRDFTSGFLHDKTFVGFMAGAIADALERPLRTAYVDMVRKELSPALSKAIDKLFSETRDLLKEGMRELTATVEENSKRGTKVMEDRLAKVCAGQHKAIVTEVERHMATVLGEITNGWSAMTETVKRNSVLTESVNEELRLMKDVMISRYSMINHDRSMGRGDSTMNVSSRCEDSIAAQEKKINEMIVAKDYAAAMNDALSKTSMPILLFACQRIPPKAILSGNHLKPSPIPCCSILALIQQLSRDFPANIDLKIKFLFDAVLSLNTEDPTLCEHIPKIFKGVARRLQAHMDQQPDSSKLESVAMLLRLVTSRCGNQG